MKRMAIGLLVMGAVLWAGFVWADNPARGRVGGAEDIGMWMPGADVPTIAGGMDANELAQHVKTVVGKINKKNLGDKNHPLAGVIFTEVSKGDRAAASGIKVGDVVTAINGEIAFKERYDQMMNKAMSQGQDFTLTVWSYGKGKRDVHFTAGFIGVVYEQYLDLARAYWRDGNRDAQWDDLMLTAGTVYKEQPRVAWNALAAAQKLGCTGAVFDLIAAETAYQLGRHEDVLAFGMPALEGVDDIVGAPLVWNVWASGILCGRVKAVQKVVDGNREDFKDQSVPVDKTIDDFMARYGALPELARTNRPPLQALRGAVVEDLSGQLVHMAFKAADTQPDAVNDKYGYTDGAVTQWNQEKKIAYRCNDDVFVMGDIGPAVADCVFDVVLTAKPHDKTLDNYYGKYCEVGVLDYSADEQTGKPVLSVLMYDSGLVEVSWEGAFGTWMLKPLADPKGKHQVKIVIVGQRATLMLDDHAIFDGVVVEDETKRKLVGFLREHAMDEDVTQMQWNRVTVPVELP